MTETTTQKHNPVELFDIALGNEALKNRAGSRARGSSREEILQIAALAIFQDVLSRGITEFTKIEDGSV